MTGTINVTASYPSGLRLTNAAYAYVTVAAGAFIGNPSGPALYGNLGTIDLTIANSGSITATGSTTGSYGIALVGAGTVANAAGGLVSGVDGGVDISGVGTVVNQGSIAALDTGLGAGVAIGGGVTNSAVNNSGSISGGYNGVFINAAGLVSNSGSIGGTNGNGIVISGTAAVVNGTLSTIAGYRIGVSIGSSGTLINQGNIISSQTSGPGYAFDSMTGKTTLFDVGAFLNSGGISNASGATISSYFFGVAIYDGGSIQNHGSISGSSTSIGFGAFLLNGGTVSNAASGMISGGSDGILIGGTNTGSVMNDGSITSGTTNAPGRAAVNILSGGYFGNTGMVTGQNVGVHLNGGGSIHNAGTITGINMSVYVGQPATVDNVGTLTSAGYKTGAVVRLLQGGTISNEASGRMSGTWIGAQIYSSASGAAPGTILNQGLMLAADTLGDGAGAWLMGPGLISNGSLGTISGGAFGVVTYNYADTLINNGTISATEYAVKMGSGGANRVVVSPGATFASLSTLTAIVDGGNPLTATVASVLELTTGSGIGAITGFGSKYIDFAQVTLDAGASWALAGTVAASQTVAFGGAGALTLTNPGSVGGTIAGFGTSDTIALAGVTDPASATLGAGNVLTVARTSGPSITLQLDPAQTFAGSNFPFSVVGGNTDLTVPCFAAGTRILTPAGEVPVEALEAGDLLVLASGRTARVRWIGRRRVDCRAHSAPRAVMPVCIRAGAIAPGVPARDLFLSPDHAVYVDGMLIPVRCLINGRSIVQLVADAVTYFHVELPRHDVMLAEGLAVESYLDTGNRSVFANAGRRAEGSVVEAFSG